MQSKNHNTVLILVGFLSALVTAILPFLVVPSFANVFESFGADLPLITIIATQYPYAFMLIPVMVLLVGFAWPNLNRRGVYACVVGTTSLFWGTGLLVIAMYLPIFKLSAAM